MKKVVINSCYGGFSISPEAALWLFKNGYAKEGFKTPVKEYWSDADESGSKSSLFGYKNCLSKWKEYLKNPNRELFLTIFTPDEKFVLECRDFERHDPLLVKCVETLGIKANGACAKLKVVEIPDEVKYVIEEYDGLESIHETHLSWS